MTGKLSIILMLTIISTNAGAQHLIGLSRNEVLDKMQETTFVIDNTSKNASFNYLKFVDKIEERTFLVFLSKNDICSSTKLMSDYSSYRSEISNFNKKYKKISSTEWNYNENGITYKVTLKKEDWFYSVVVTTKTK